MTRHLSDFFIKVTWFDYCSWPAAVSDGGALDRRRKVSYNESGRSGRLSGADTDYMKMCLKF